MNTQESKVFSFKNSVPAEYDQFVFAADFLRLVCFLVDVSFLSGNLCVIYHEEMDVVYDNLVLVDGATTSSC